MEIDDAGELIFRTYYMMDWGAVKQSPSDARCVSCDERMSVVEEVRDKKGARYEGRACHRCKAVFWVRL